MSLNFEPGLLVTPVLLILTILLSPLPRYALALFSEGRKDASTEAASKADEPPCAAQGYIVPAHIHHARMLPRESQHSFQYPSVYLAFELHGLEKGEIDCAPGFSWTPKGLKNGRGSSSITHLHPDGFGRKTFPDAASPAVSERISQSILLKLVYELRFRNYIPVGPQDLKDPDPLAGDLTPWDNEIGQVWAIAMPTVFGLAGFNPLTVYYVYRPSLSQDNERGKLWLAILEVHNTFNERHIYVCEATDEAQQRGSLRKGYDYSWTFARDFHVSPFNDRLGSYQLFLGDLWDDKATNTIPSIDIRLLLLVPDEKEENGKSPLQKKLLATLTSSLARSSTNKPARPARPLQRATVLSVLLRQPFDLFLPVSRIMWEAAKLHWKRRLPVHIRPEPQGEAVNVQAVELASIDAEKKQTPFDGLGWPKVLNPVEQEKRTNQSSGDIYWNDESVIERVCKKTVEKWLVDQTGRDQTGASPSVLIRTRNPESDDVLFANGKRQSIKKTEEDSQGSLTMYTLSSAMYVDLCLYAPIQARLFGSQIERAWGVSDWNRYLDLLQVDKLESPASPSKSVRFVRFIRARYMRWAVHEALQGMLSESTDKVEQEKRLNITSKLVKQASSPHPFDRTGYSLALIGALLLHVFSLILMAGASKLLHVHYVRHPWAQVGEGLAFLSSAGPPSLKRGSA